MNPDQLLIQSLKDHIGELTFENLRLQALLHLKDNQIAELQNGQNVPEPQA